VPGRHHLETRLRSQDGAFTAVVANDQGGSRAHGGDQLLDSYGEFIRPHYGPGRARGVTGQLQLVDAAVAPDFFRLPGELQAGKQLPGRPTQVKEPRRPRQSLDDIRVELRT
jgi:hypothetical protein